MVRVAIGGRLQQIAGLLAMCFIVSVIAHKGFHDISALLEHYPEEFWRAFARYALNNLAGG